LRPQRRQFPGGKGKTLSVIGKTVPASTCLKYWPASATHHGRDQSPREKSALIELGAGFHPEISGRENIFINGLSWPYQEKNPGTVG